MGRDGCLVVDGSYQEVACCYSSDDALTYIDIHCDEDSHIEDMSVTTQARFRPALVISCSSMSSPSRPGLFVGMDKTKQVQQLCSEHSKELKGLALDVCSHGRWDMNLPVAVIDARKALSLPHFSSGNHRQHPAGLPTADHPLMQQLFGLYESGL